ncbi:hypothetical protein, partial [Mesorhizobium sp.]|uniref:hypothetical protein n=1 Tax=Mesorhizobium sp. TaxID=1871066 RepID=UPI0025C490CF
ALEEEFFRREIAARRDAVGEIQDPAGAHSSWNGSANACRPGLRYELSSLFRVLLASGPIGVAGTSCPSVFKGGLI